MDTIVSIDFGEDIYARKVAPADFRTRVRLALACTDCDDIPKVEGAGEVFKHEDGKRVQRMHNGVLVYADGYYGAWMSDIIRILAGHHEPQEERAFHHVLQCVSPGSVMIEGGAFWSYYSLWFQHAIADARNVMIEPNAQNLDLGRRNFALNRRTGEFIHAMIGASDARPNEGVATVCVDSVVRDQAIEQVAILHMDIQGYEMNMLEGARETLARHGVDYAFISTHSDPSLHYPCLAWLSEIGYVLIAEHDKRDSFSFDGLIVARAPHARAPEPFTLSRRSAFSGRAQPDLLSLPPIPVNSA